MKFRTLCAKILATILPVLAVALGLTTYLQVKEAEKDLQVQFREETGSLTATIDASLRHAMANVDAEALDNIVRRVGKSDSISRLYTLNSEGKIIRSSNSSQEQEESSQQIADLKRTGGSLFELRYTADGRPYVHSVAPVRAEATCLQCHSDIKEGEPAGYIGLDRWADAGFARLKASQSEVLWLNFATILLLGGVVLFIVRKVTRPLKGMADAALRIAQGDVTQVIDHQSDDEIGTLAAAFRDLIGYFHRIADSAEALSRGSIAADVQPLSERDALGHSFQRLHRTIQELTNETEKLVQAARRGQLAVRGDAARFEGAFLNLVSGINHTLDSMVQPMREAAGTLDRVAQRDLAVRMTGSYEGDFTLLQKSLNKALDNLEEALSQVAAGAEQVSSAATQISSGSQSLSAGASEQAASLEQVAASMQQMSQMNHQNAGNAKEASEISALTRTASEAGVQSMRRLSESIDGIKASADATAKIIKTIDELAFQTNLLALNAAVEAARAGDAGKGFAVVAEEVRSLAMRSADAARQTATLIEESVRNAEGGVDINREVMQHFEDINTRVEKLSTVMGEIFAASAEQSRGAEQINTALDQMNQVTQQVAASAEESAAASEELSSEAAEMLEAVRSFKINEAFTGRSASPVERIA